MSLQVKEIKQSFTSLFVHMKCLGILYYQGLLPKVFLPFSFYRGLVSMIRYLLLQNRQGKTRLSKWYMPVEFEEQARLEN